jgi:hypothetical protein
MIRVPKLVSKFGAENKGTLVTKKDLDDYAAASQVWLSPVETFADLPVITDTSRTWLCRVIEDNTDYQCVQGQTEWAVFSSGGEGVTPVELAEAVEAHNQDTDSHQSILTLISAEAARAEAAENAGATALFAENARALAAEAALSSSVEAALKTSDMSWIDG